MRRVLLDPRGREVLKKLGIDIDLVDEKKPQESLPTIAVLCPTYRAPEPQMQDALAAMVRHTRDSGKAIVYGGPPVSASVVHWSRNWLVSEQIKSGKPWTHVLFIDDDIVVEPDTLLRLLSHKKDIVAGLCTRRTDPPVPNIRCYDDKTGTTRQIWEWPENSLMEVGAVGTGLMLISRHALEQVAEVYFRCLWEKEFYGFSGEKLARLESVRREAFDKEKICYWFRFLPTDLGNIEMGEDITFCHLAKKYAEIPVYADTSVQPGHIGPYPYSIKDFLPYRDNSILAAKIKGEYPMEVPDMKISILCPTRGRPDNVNRLLGSIHDTATIMPEVVFYVDDDDASFPGAVGSSDVKVVRGPRILMSEMWNKCLEASTGEILMMGGDDLIFRTKGWDDQVRRAFATFPDRLVFVHGDDGHWHEKFGTHGFLHRNWIDVIGYFCPPYFTSDYNDTWWNDIANAVNRRVYLPFVTEHMHPVWGKAEWDKTHKERMARTGGRDYAELAPERERDAKIIHEAIWRYGKGLPARQPELASV